jgi:hypothetical protein
VTLDGTLAHGNGLCDPDGCSDKLGLVVHDPLDALHGRVVGVVDVARCELDFDDCTALIVTRVSN